MDNNETTRPVCSCCGATTETDDYYTFDGSIYAMTATTEKLSLVSIAVTESGPTIMQALTVCRSAIPATTITTRPVNAAVESFIGIVPTMTMTMITPTATAATRNASTVPFTNTATSRTRYFTATRSAISAWNLRSTRAARAVTMRIRFWTSATGLRSTSTLNPTAASRTEWR